MTERSPAELILAHQKRLGQVNATEQEPISALEYLQSIYRNPTEETGKRIRAATEALPHESPRMASVAVGYFTGQDFATRLEKAIEASNRAKVIEGRVLDSESE
jgi:hypothetical protein